MSSKTRTIRRSIERERNPQPRQYARRRKGHAWEGNFTNFDPIQRIRQALQALRMPSMRKDKSQGKAGER